MAARRGPLSDGRGIGEVRCSVLTKDGAKVVAQVRIMNLIYCCISAHTRHQRKQTQVSCAYILLLVVP